MEKHKIEFNFNVGEEVFFMHKNTVARGIVSEIDIKVTTVQAQTRPEMSNTWTPKYNIIYRIMDTKNKDSLSLEPLSVHKEQSLLFGTKQELIESL